MTSRSDVVSNPFTADLIRRKAAFLSRSAGFTRSEEEDLRQEMALFLMTKRNSSMRAAALSRRSSPRW